MNGPRCKQYFPCYTIGKGPAAQTDFWAITVVISTEVDQSVIGKIRSQGQLCDVWTAGTEVDGLIFYRGQSTIERIHAL